MPFTTCKDCGNVGVTSDEEFIKGGPFQCDECYEKAEMLSIYQSYEIVDQDMAHTLEVVQLVKKFQQSAVEQFSKILPGTPELSLETVRLMAFDWASNKFGETCILASADFEPTDYEIDMLISVYVLAALEYAEQILPAPTIITE